MRKGMEKKMASLLLELLKDSKRSDREIAKVLGVSQPTVSRMRWRLEEEGWIKDFTIIPDFVKMGYEIMAISSFKSKTGKEITERSVKWTHAKPNIIFASRAHGMGKDAVIISLHKNYTDYAKFITDLRLELGDYVRDHNSLLISLEERIVKPFSLTYLGEQEET